MHPAIDAATRARLWEEADLKALAETHAAVAGRNKALLTQIETETAGQSRSFKAIDTILIQAG